MTAAHSKAAAIELTALGRYTLLQSQAGRSQGSGACRLQRKSESYDVFDLRYCR